MEGTVFLDAAVAAELAENWVEARLHCDVGPGTSKELSREHRELEKQMLGTTANPYFAVVDPTNGRVLASTEYESSPSQFLEFLQRN